MADGVYRGDRCNRRQLGVMDPRRAAPSRRRPSRCVTCGSPRWGARTARWATGRR